MNARTMIKTTFSKWIDHGTPRLGAALAYDTSFSLAPLRVIAAVAFLALTGGDAAADRLRDRDPLEPPPLVHRQWHDWLIVPLVAFDTDRGLGVGAMASVARTGTDIEPFVWRLQVHSFTTIKRSPTGGLEAPFHDYGVVFDRAGLWRRRLRIAGGVYFSRHNTAGYYGVGNASTFSPTWEGISPAADPEAYKLARRRYQYERIFPNANVDLRVRLVRPLSLWVAGSYTYNWLTVHPQSKLAEDIAAAANDPGLATLLIGTERHGGALFHTGVLWDTRDEEGATTHGLFCEASLRGAPGWLTRAPHSYGGANITLRGFYPLFQRRVVIGARVMADALFGQAPFYELARHGGTSAGYSPGGGTAIRGVPLQRYHGRVKLVATTEVRVTAVRWRRRSTNIALGVALFADVGRVWADFRASTDLDGTNVGLKVGAGGGFRLQLGNSATLRADVAWSPDAQPVGVYVDLAQVF